jgi:alpha/beta hydrolase fold
MGSSGPYVRRVADLRLRHARVRVLWPDGDDPALLVLVAGVDDELAADLCSRAGLVVLAPAWGAPATLDWAARHGAELGADAGRLAVAGAGAGAAEAATLALRARDLGWPRLARQILIEPATTAPQTRAAGVAPATVVAGRTWAALLRRAGVEVEELDDRAQLAPALRRSLGGPA